MQADNVTDSTRAVVQCFFEALLERNLEKITPLFHEEVDWYIPGPERLAAWLGKRRTRREVKTFFEQLWQQTEPIDGHVEATLVEGSVALTAGRFTVRMRQTGKMFASLFFIQITVENQQIVRYRLLEEGYGLAQALTQ